jgi:hypothetical protein
MTIRKTDLSRLEHFRTTVRAMRAGHFRVAVPPGSDKTDAIDALGHELTQLAGWLDRRFAEFRKLQEVAVEIGGGLFTDNVLDRIYNSFSALIPYDRIGCALLVEEERALRAYWARATYPDLKINRGFTARMAGSSLETIFSTGKPRTSTIWRTT